ncbi:Sec63 [Allomyces javanicus]|nr:Sec63 [Allomyces javanicus]
MGDFIFRLDARRLPGSSGPSAPSTTAPPRRAPIWPRRPGATAAAATATSADLPAASSPPTPPGVNRLVVHRPETPAPPRRSAYFTAPAAHVSPVAPRGAGTESARFHPYATPSASSRAVSVAAPNHVSPPRAPFRFATPAATPSHVAAPAAGVRVEVHEPSSAAWNAAGPQPANRANTPWTASQAATTTWATQAAATVDAGARQHDDADLDALLDQFEQELDEGQWQFQQQQTQQVAVPPAPTPAPTPTPAFGVTSQPVHHVPTHAAVAPTWTSSAQLAAPPQPPPPVAVLPPPHAGYVGPPAPPPLQQPQWGHGPSHGVAPAQPASQPANSMPAWLSQQYAPAARPPPAHVASQLVPANSLGRPVKMVSEIRTSSNLLFCQLGQDADCHKVALALRFRSMFSFPSFNFMQSECFDAIMSNNRSLVVSSPTGSGKTVLMELALIHQWTAVDPHARAVYLAPTKALCTERAADWHRKLHPLGIKVQELTGDSDWLASSAALTAPLVVTTPEKWDSITRRSSGGGADTGATNVRLVLVDEVHLLSERRGSTLEAILTRMRVAHQNQGRALRILALSATFPNVADVAEWLRADAKVFGDEYRPVQLDRVVVGYPTHGKNAWQFEKSLSHHIPGLIRDHARHKPVLIFCNSRKAAEATAKHVVDELRGPAATPAGTYHPYVTRIDQRNALAAAAPQCKAADLKALVPHGVAFHHAGLDMVDRRGLEQLFLHGHLLVLCTTTTLAVGINLPAFCVIVKGTSGWDATAGGARDYSDLEILQMMGRAGRPQFDSQGKAIVMTEAGKAQRYQTMVQGQDVIESSLHQNLAEHLNAEIALGSVATANDAVEWLRNTFLYVRLQRRPQYYGMTADELPDLVHRCVAGLVRDGFLVVRPTDREEPVPSAAVPGPPPVPWNPHAPLACTEFGLIMARYYLSLKTMLRLLATGGSIPQQLFGLAQAEEFASLYVHAGDRAPLQALNGAPETRFPLPPATGLAAGAPGSGTPTAKVKTPAEKVFLIIQGVLSGATAAGAAAGQLAPHADRLRMLLTIESGLIWQHAFRVLRALADIHATRRDARALRAAVAVHQGCRARVWFDSPRPLRQIDRIGPAITAGLASAGVTSLNDLRACAPWKIEQVAHRHPPFGTQILEAVDRMPKVDASVAFGRPAGVEVTVRVANPANRCTTHVKGAAVHVAVLVEDDAGQLVAWHRVPVAQLVRSGGKVIVLPPGTPRLTVSVMVEDFVGLDVHLTVDLKHAHVAKSNEWTFPNDAFAPPAAFLAPVPATPAVMGPPPPPPSQSQATQQPGPPSSRIDAWRPPPPSTTLAPPSWPIPAAASATAAEKPARKRAAKDQNKACAHKCKDKSKCAHACCKRGLLETSQPPPMPPSVPSWAAAGTRQRPAPATASQQPPAAGATAPAIASSNEADWLNEPLELDWSTDSDFATPPPVAAARRLAQEQRQQQEAARPPPTRQPSTFEFRSARGAALPPPTPVAPTTLSSPASSFSSPVTSARVVSSAPFVSSPPSTGPWAMSQPPTQTQTPREDVPVVDLVSSDFENEGIPSPSSSPFLVASLFPPSSPPPVPELVAPRPPLPQDVDMEDLPPLFPDEEIPVPAPPVQVPARVPSLGDWDMDDDLPPLYPDEIVPPPPPTPAPPTPARPPRRILRPTGIATLSLSSSSPVRPISSPPAATATAAAPLPPPPPAVAAQGTDTVPSLATMLADVDGTRGTWRLEVLSETARAKVLDMIVRRRRAVLAERLAAARAVVPGLPEVHDDEAWRDVDAEGV